MQTVTIHDAKTNLSKYIAAAKKGETIYIGSFGKPEVVLAKLKPLSNKPKTRDFSIFKGKIIATDDAFSDKTEQEIAKLMYGDDSSLKEE